MSVTSTRLLSEHELLDAARGGDEATFRHIVESHRGELHTHCYRMLGSFTMRRTGPGNVPPHWRGRAGFGGRIAVRTWLYRIATNVCRDAIRAGRIAPPIGYDPASGPGDDSASPSSSRS